MRTTIFSRSLFVLGCFGVLAMGAITMTGCSAGEDKKQAEKKEAPFHMEVFQVDQLNELGSKTPDGQYLVIKAQLKNLGNKSLELAPTDFSLENITENEEERYSQPMEKGLNSKFRATYGEEVKDRLVENNPVNLYPRMSLERYFIFMVPSNAKIDGYQITYVPEKISAPLVVTGTTIINDHRNHSELPPTEE